MNNMIKKIPDIFLDVSWTVGVIIGIIVDQYLPYYDSRQMLVSAFLFAVGCSMLATMIYIIVNKQNINRKCILIITIQQFVSIVILISYYIVSILR